MYPTREVLAAYAAARRDGAPVPPGDPLHGEVVRFLERRRYLPRDRRRVEALEARATAAARVRLAVPRPAEQLALPLNGGWWDDPAPTQLALPLGL